MKSLLMVLGSIGLTSSVGAPVILSHVNSETIHQQAQESVQGTLTTNLISSQEIEDWSMGGSDSATKSNSKKILWAEMGITKEMYNRIDFKNSSLEVDIKIGYGDNSGSGNSGESNKSGSFNNIDRFWYSGKLGEKEFEDFGRHHGGSGRSTDHEWLYSVSTESDGILIWDYVWVWANGNWGNVARSVADINIKSLYYNFKLL